MSVKASSKKEVEAMGEKTKHGISWAMVGAIVAMAITLLSFTRDTFTKPVASLERRVTKLEAIQNTVSENLKYIRVRLDEHVTKHEVP
jgi:hypothetical protein